MKSNIQSKTHQIYSNVFMLSNPERLFAILMMLRKQFQNFLYLNFVNIVASLHQTIRHFSSVNEEKICKLSE